MMDGDYFDFRLMPLSRPALGYAIQRFGSDMILDKSSGEFLSIRSPELQGIYQHYHAARGAAVDYLQRHRQKNSVNLLNCTQRIQIDVNHQISATQTAKYLPPNAKGLAECGGLTDSGNLEKSENFTESGNLAEDLIIVPVAFDRQLRRHVLIYGVIVDPHPVDLAAFYAAHRPMTQADEPRPCQT